MWSRYTLNANPTEEVQFRNAVKRADKLLREMAAGADSCCELKEFEKVVRAVDRAEDLSRFVEPEKRELAYALRRRIADAREAGRLVRQAERNAELHRLREEKREEEAGLTTYERELRLMKGGRLR
jgi:hypothetical protein